VFLHQLQRLFTPGGVRGQRLKLNRQTFSRITGANADRVKLLNTV